jgi:helicase-like protein
MTRWRWDEPHNVRAQIGAACGLHDPGRMTLGDVVLRDHQRAAASRLRIAIDRYGGALLADEVGLGKTYAALATARDARSLLVVAPAALASMWRAALDRTRLRADFISFETLSHRDPPGQHPELVIVDEAHHARNPGTRRYARLAALTRSAQVLLLSATPVHNAAADLRSLLALFLGSRADRLSAAELAACIVRRARSDVHGVAVPARAEPEWREVDGPAEVLRTIVDMPAPCPPRDGGDAGALVTLSLVRAWASSDGALRAALRRRIARAEALRDALESGRHPTRAELRAWVVGDDATQLAFPELVADAAPRELRAFLDAVRRHVDGARGALAAVAAAEGTADDRRAAIIREIRQRHRGERIVVFSQFADTVREMFARLRGDGRVASVTANGALVAGGPLTRAQVLDRFAPVATGSASPARAEAVEVLIATDLLSEGLNLQDASVVVHLDLPWTTARLTQRLGRVWRMGSRHDRVHEYAIAPPAPGEELLRIMRILSRKAGDAWSALGEPFAPLLARRVAQTATADPATDPFGAEEELRALLRRWMADAAEQRRAVAPSAEPSDGDEPLVVAAVRAPIDGWIAALEVHGEARLVASRAGSTTTDSRATVALARLADGAGCVASPSRVDRVLREIDAYLESARAAADAGVAAIGSRARATAASRIAALATAAPPHRRVAMSRLAASARHAVARSRTAGAERLLAALVASDDREPAAAETWLERIAGVGAGALPNEDDGAPSEPGRTLALIVLVPSTPRVPEH